MHKRITINFDRQYLDEFDKIAGNRKRNVLLEEVLINELQNGNLNNELSIKKKIFFTSSIELEENLINKIDKLVGKDNRSAFIRWCIEKYLRERKNGE